MSVQIVFPEGLWSINASLRLKDTILLHQPTTDSIINVQIRLLVEYNFLHAPTACIPTDAIAEAPTIFHPELEVN